jgi:hypothetical protein
MWTKKKQSAYRRQKAIEKLIGPTDFAWVQAHENYIPEKPKLMRMRTYRRIRKRLARGSQPKNFPEDQ